MKDYFKQLFEYDKWANQTLLSLFEKQFPQNPRIYQLLSHILSAQRVWLDRCMGLPQSTGIWAERIPDEMAYDTENYNLAWIEFIDSLNEDVFSKIIDYKNSKGDQFQNTLSDIAAHVVNHGTHHRGQIIILIKEEGFVPPLLDYIYFIRK